MANLSGFSQENEAKTTNATNEAITTLDIVKNSSSAYSIVYGSGGSNNATQLQKAIKNKTGCTLPIKSDGATETDYEIVLGPTNARPGHWTYNSYLGTFGYRFGISGRKLIITASDANHMAAALFQFENMILKNSELAGSGFFKFRNTDDQFTNFRQTQATLRNLIKNGYSWYSLSLTEICRCNRDGLNIAQGAGSDGTYIYLVNRNREQTASRVYKYTMSGSYVGCSASFNSYHSNDLTVDTKNGRVLVCHGGTGSPGGSAYNITTAVNTSNLAVIGQVHVSTTDGITALTYNPHTNMYAGARGHVIYMMKEASGFTAYETYTRNPATEQSTAYTSQGAGSDIDYIYFPMSGSGSTLIPVYSWDGLYRNWNFKVSSSYEVESMFESNGVYYLYYYISGSGGVVYRLNISMTYNTRL